MLSSSTISTILCGHTLQEAQTLLTTPSLSTHILLILSTFTEAVIQVSYLFVAFPDEYIRST